MNERWECFTRRAMNKNRTWRHVMCTIGRERNRGGTIFVCMRMKVLQYVGTMRFSPIYIPVDLALFYYCGCRFTTTVCARWEIS